MFFFGNTINLLRVRTLNSIAQFSSFLFFFNLSSRLHFNGELLTSGEFSLDSIKIVSSFTLSDPEK